MKLKDHDRFGILGITGTGKSHFTKKRIVNPAERCVVWDIMGEYAEECSLDEVTFDELLTEPELLDNPNCRIAVVPEWDNPKDLAEQFEAFAQMLRYANHSTSCLGVIEECSMLRPKADGSLIMLAACARHWKMPLVFVAQRATMVPPGARTQWNNVISFRQNEPGDLDALAERIGQGKADEVAELPPRRFVKWNENDWQKNKKDKQQDSEVDDDGDI